MRLKNIDEKAVEELDKSIGDWVKKSHDALGMIADEAVRLRDALGEDKADQRKILLDVFPLHAAIEDVMLNLQAALAAGYTLSVVGEFEEDESKEEEK